MSEHPWIVALADAGAGELAQVGGKALGLHALLRAGLPVPAGYCVTTAAFRAALGGAPAVAAALASLSGLQAEDTVEIRRAAAQVREAVAAVELPPALAEQVLAAWRTITGSDKVAVRSSATAEDLSDASFAGQQDTHLEVGGDELLARLRACWASLWSDRAVAYRLRHGLGAADVAMAVVVQRMLAPEAAGVLFTADPVRGHRGVAAIEAVPGLGESLVSGHATPQTYRIRKRDLAVLDATTQEGAPRLLDERLTRALVDLAIRAERARGEPLDLEWAVAGGTPWLLQARAITTLSPLPEPAPTDGAVHAYLSFGHVQVNTAPLSPMAISVFQRLIPLGRDASGSSSLVAAAGGRLYVDVTPMLSRAPFDRTLPKIIARASRPIGERLAAVAARPEWREQAPRVRVELSAVVRRIAPMLARAAGTLVRGPQRTRARFLVRLEAELAGVRARVAAGQSPAERLVRVRDEISQAFQWLLFELGLPMLFPAILGEAEVRALTRRYAPGEPEDALLRGLEGNSTTQMDLELGDLADLARSSPTLVAALAAEDPATALAAARGRPGTEAFFAGWAEFLARYGHRAAGEIDVALPRWREAPGLLLRTLAGILQQPPGAHRALHEAARARAEEARARVLAAAGEGPLGGLRRRLVRRAVDHVRTIGALREHHKAAMMLLFDMLRRAALEVGAELVRRGELAAADDVWMLSLDALVEAAERAERGAPPASLRLVVATQRRALERYATWSPPPVLTSEGEAVPAPPQQGAPADTLVGTGVSSGVFEGVVRVVHDPATETLAAGEVLVATYTDPGWTPLFMHAGAVVIEVGGTMTHGSVIARELGIPAVVAVERATQALRTGMRVRVDGERGWVQIAAPAAGGAR